MTYKVLIVDDSKLARMSAAKLLANCCPDFSRVEASSAADALGIMQKDAPDIALLDFNMPDRDGLHLAEDLRKLNPRMPIAVISANRQQEVINRARSVGATFLAKPLDHDSLAGFMKTAEQVLRSASA
jgi:CheY-like chemotaxis protein